MYGRASVFPHVDSVILTQGALPSLNLLPFFSLGFTILSPAKDNHFVSSSLSLRSLLQPHVQLPRPALAVHPACRGRTVTGSIRAKTFSSPCASPPYKSDSAVSCLSVAYPHCPKMHCAVFLCLHYTKNSTDELDFWKLHGPRAPVLSLTSSLCFPHPL